MLTILLHKLKNGPTILSLSEILHTMKQLQMLDEKEIIKHDDTFLEMLDILVDSYTHAAIYEVDDIHESLLQEFNVWLISLGTKKLFGKNKEDLQSYAMGFSMRM